MKGERHSWASVACDLKYNKALIYNVAHGLKPAPIKLIDRVNEVYGQRIHYPRAPLPKECWCGKTHQQKRVRKVSSWPVIKRDWSRFCIELLGKLQ